MENVKIYKIVFSVRIKDYMENWNMSTHKWLKYYVFLRMLNKGQKVGLTPLLTTFVVSAIWHGFYPGYLIFFVAAGLTDYYYKLGEKSYLLLGRLPLLPFKLAV